MEQRHGGDGRHNKRPDKYRRSNFKWQDRGNRDCRDTYDKRDKKQDDKTPPDCSNKALKPCSVHGPKSTPLRSATRTQGMTNVNFKTRSTPMKRIITTHATQATMMNHALARIHRSLVRIRCQLQARARRITKMRSIIFMFKKNWRQVAMCLASLTINDRGASSSWVKKDLMMSWIRSILTCDGLRQWKL